MFAQLKRLGADSLLYAFMNVGTKIIAFIMLPIYTHFLPPAKYGVLGIIDNWTSMLTFLIIFGTDSALSFYYFETKDENKRIEYVRTVIYIQLFIVSLLALVVLVGGPMISRAFLDDAKNVTLLYISIATLVVDTMTVVVLMVMRFDFKTKKVVVYTVSKMLLMAILSYVFLKYFIRTAEGILLGRFVSFGIIFLLLFPRTVKYLKPRIKMDMLKEILAYAAPLVPASLAFWVIANSSVFFLNAFHSKKDVGIYTAATRLGTIITLLTSGVQIAWRPYSMNLKDKESSPLLFSKIFLALLLLGVFGIMAIATVIPYIINILGPKYHPAYQYVALISAATFLNFYYMIISVGLFFTKKTGSISVTFGIVAVVNTVLNLALIPAFDIWGAVVSYLVAYMTAVVFIFRRSQKVYYVPVSFGKMTFLFVSMLAAVSSVIYVQLHGMSVIYIAAAWLALFLLVGLSRVDKDLRRREYAAAKQ